MYKSWLIGKESDAGQDWGQEEKGTTEDEMAGLHHWLDGCESEWTPGVSDGQGGLACCDSWGHKESDTTEQLNWTEGKTEPECLKEPASLPTPQDNGLLGGTGIFWKSDEKKWKEYMWSISQKKTCMYSFLCHEFPEAHSFL